MFLPNLDGDFVDVSGRREDGCGGSGRGRRTAAGLLALGGWCSGCTARASCLFRSFAGRHFLKRGGLVIVVLWFQDSIFTNIELQRIGGGREDGRTEVLGSH